ncbi:hypothetical protein [Sphingobium bisphenolivorans]|uniref:hypothetical protein n=1 Tax=Sphingobium bisphenolivorans TaxID=1335760 RepID=UPI0003B5D264|nr:hypothetical protein [Sphingobium bisphenolivorans]
MSLTLIALAATAAPLATHHVQINHGGAPVQATYSARADIRSKTVGTKAPTRMDMQRCRWTAMIVVDRALSHTPALARTVSSDHRLSGSDHGACPRGDIDGASKLAQHAGKIREHLVTVAEQDRAPLLAELDAVRNLASN